MAHINAASRLAHALRPGDATLTVFVVLQVDAEDPLLGVSDQLKILNIAFFFEDPSDTRFHPGSRNVHLIEARLLPVPYTVK